VAATTPQLQNENKPHSSEPTKRSVAEQLSIAPPYKIGTEKNAMFF